MSKQTPKEQEEMTIEDQLDMILRYMERFNRRDRFRTTISFVHAVAVLIPMILFLYAGWTIYSDMDGFLEMISTKAAEAAMGVTQKTANGSIPMDVVKQFEAMIPHLK